ncbi:SPOR domain-containing protein [Arenibacter sp. GZD96]|uniref:HU domain-containing protein n=1 Tax=Aurantibrevibacter litoralis TaxID=3106030 RepID=UPI002AFEDE56|nr:SPOR domain-containing protein [Arenibacter sp. GZD-96]MEA1786666.1 SPOR domain-containing protein [Arenibacter sp. GZD-96]
MDIQRSIEELLYRYNCVVVPGFGAFLAQHKSAVLHEATHTLYPPSKTLSFNEQLSSNDGLLVSYVASEENKPFDEVLKDVVVRAKQWKQQLQDGNRLVWDNIGELWLTKEGKIQFQPSNQVNYLTSSFGLAAFRATPVQREVLKEEVLELEEKIPFTFTPEERRQWSVRPYLKYAAVLLLALSLGFTGYRIYNQNTTTSMIARQEAQQKVSKTIQEATFFNKIPLELPSLTIEVTKENTLGAHQIVAGAFRMQENADKKVQELRQKGYNAAYVGVNTYGLHMVIYDSFDQVKEALAFLRNVKQEESPEAWMLSVK